MAGLTHTIGGVNFGALNTSAGRKSLGCYPTSLNYQYIRFHAPGSNGRFLIHGNRDGGTIQMDAAYVDSLANVHSAFQSDRNAWENTAVVIVDSTGINFTRCMLVNGSMHIAKRPFAIGRTGFVRMDVTAAFDVDS